MAEMIHPQINNRSDLVTRRLPAGAILINDHPLEAQGFQMYFLNQTVYIVLPNGVIMRCVDQAATHD